MNPGGGGSTRGGSIETQKYSAMNATSGSVAAFC